MQRAGLVVAAASVLAILGQLSAAAAAREAPRRDGTRFDPGARMTARAESAPAELDWLAGYLGLWEVEFRRLAGDSVISAAEGLAEVTYMNRGHGFMERFYCPDLDGQGTEYSTIWFLAFHAGSGSWMLGEANGHRENVSLFDGSRSGEALVLRNAIRRLGRSLVTDYRLTIPRPRGEGFLARLEESTDHGDSWTTTVEKTYRRRAEGPGLTRSTKPYGEPAPDLPEQARAFDFMIGEWSELHQMKLPGRDVEFPANGTAVYALNGKAVMEYSWYDVDTNLPDAATSIVRIYNRQMRRWECMYCTNRFDSILRFGGVQEGDRIVLHQFGADRTDVPMSYWIFHDWTADGYRWHAATSTDGGETFEKTWVITATRKEGHSASHGH